MVVMVLGKKNSACCKLQDWCKNAESEMNISCKPLIDLLMKSRHKKLECFQLIYILTKY